MSICHVRARAAMRISRPSKPPCSASCGIDFQKFHLSYSPHAMTSEQTKSRTVALIVASVFFMQMLDGAIMNTSLPQMALSFGVLPVALSIGITIYTLTVAAFVPLSGWLANRFGTRNIFLLAILVFTLASFCCGMAGSLPAFVAARAVQGLGGAMMTPVGRMVVLRNASKSELLQATALITWPALFAPVIGPVLGGFVTTYFSWRWNFLLNIPLGLSGLALVGLYVPQHVAEHRQPLDIRGFVLSSTGLVSLLFGLESFAHAHVRAQWMLALGLIASGVLFVWLAVRHFLRTPHPLLDLSAFKVQTFAVSSLWAGTYIRIAVAATPFLLPLLFQVGFGLTPLAAGGLIFAYFVGNLGMKTITTPTLRRFGFRSVLAVNGALSGLSIMACALFDRDTPHSVLMAILLIAGLTRSMEFTALNTLAFSDIGSAQRSSASTLASMLQQVSTVLGIALAAFLLNASQTMRGAATLGITDFRVAFMVVGAVGLLASWRFLQLPADAGAEVTGHCPRSTA
jgi:EmrB/QacA subfamily drug resistance transporter